MNNLHQASSRLTECSNSSKQTSSIFEPRPASPKSELLQTKPGTDPGALGHASPFPAWMAPFLSLASVFPRFFTTHLFSYSYQAAYAAFLSATFCNCYLLLVLSSALDTAMTATVSVCPAFLLKALMMFSARSRAWTQLILRDSIRATWHHSIFTTAAFGFHTPQTSTSNKSPNSTLLSKFSCQQHPKLFLFTALLESLRRIIIFIYP